MIFVRCAWFPLLSIALVEFLLMRFINHMVRMSSKKILVVDDEKLIRMSLSLFLEERGYRVDSASTGEESISKLFQKKYDLMITDLKLPDINGMEVIKVAKKVMPLVKVIAITAFDTEPGIEKKIREFKGEILYKPFTLQKINESVCKILEG